VGARRRDAKVVEKEHGRRGGVEGQEKDRVRRGGSGHLAEGGEQDVFVLEDGGPSLNELGAAGKGGCAVVGQVVDNAAAQGVGFGVIWDLMFSALSGDVVAGAGVVIVFLVFFIIVLEVVGGVSGHGEVGGGLKVVSRVITAHVSISASSSSL
jgi:hypothetical protein